MRRKASSLNAYTTVFGTAFVQYNLGDDGDPFNSDIGRLILKSPNMPTEVCIASNLFQVFSFTIATTTYFDYFATINKYNLHGVVYVKAYGMNYFTLNYSLHNADDIKRLKEAQLQNYLKY